jgi:hypothetical protein
MKFIIILGLLVGSFSSFAGTFTIRILGTNETVSGLVVRRIDHFYNDFADMSTPNPAPNIVNPKPTFTLQITTRVENTAVERKIYWSFNTYADSVAFKNSLHSQTSVSCSVTPMGAEFTYRVNSCSI